MKIVIFGANGFLGRALSRHFMKQGYEVVGICRRMEGCLENVNFVHWDGLELGEWKKSLDGARAVVNLAGRTVNCRYTDENKAQIMNSRTQTTKLIAEAIRSVENPPEVWVNSSTATIYEHREQGERVGPHTEKNGIVGDDFSMNVAKEWEQAFFSEQVTRVRKVAARTAIVLGAEKGTVFDKLSGFSRVGLGGTMGKGTQMVSWIHEDDFCHAIEHLIQNDSEGVVNVVAPHAENNKTLMLLLRKVWKIPFGLPAMNWMLEIGTFLLKSETELVLKSRWVYPERLLKEGYEFKFDKLESALQDLREKS